MNTETKSLGMEKHYATRLSIVYFLWGGVCLCYLLFSKISHRDIYGQLRNMISGTS